LNEPDDWSGRKKPPTALEEASCTDTIYFLSTFLSPKGSKWGNSIRSNFAYSWLVTDLVFRWKRNRSPIGTRGKASSAGTCALFTESKSVTHDRPHQSVHLDYIDAIHRYGFRRNREAGESDVRPDGGFME